ncbi:MAG: MerR family transcriptional regulator [Oscillospiraceae bacterium]|nr:MerR family transcriptional regulator [Oscillospiraceae bacterium]
MDGYFNPSEHSLMSGFTTRTLRSYLNQGLLKGEKTDGAWRFSAEEVDRFFSEPFVREGLRIKQSALVFGFLADRRAESGRACVILDLPASRSVARAIYDLFCAQKSAALDAVFMFA